MYFGGSIFFINILLGWSRCAQWEAWVRKINYAKLITILEWVITFLMYNHLCINYILVTRLHGGGHKM